MNVRTATDALFKFYNAGYFGDRLADGNGYGHRPWSVVWTAEQLARGLDSYQYAGMTEGDIATYFPWGPRFSTIRASECWAKSDVQRPIDPQYLGLIGANANDTLLSMQYLEDPINALAVSMGVPWGIDNGGVDYQLDLRSYLPIGSSGSARYWTDVVSAPPGGWPVLLWTAGSGAWCEGEYDEGTSGYNSGFSGLSSRFTLPANPQFSFSVFFAEPWKLRGDYVPSIDIIYGGCMCIRIMASGRIHVFQNWQNPGGDWSWVALQEIKGGSIHKNNPVQTKAQTWQAATVYTTTYGVAISTSGSGTDLMYWERPASNTDGRLTPSAEWPQGTPFWVPSAPISFASNVGRWGFQLFPLAPATGRFFVNGDAWLRPARMQGPVTRTPHDWYAAGDVQVAYSAEWPDNNLLDATIRLVAACQENDTDGLLHQVPLTSAERYMVPVLDLATAMHRSIFTMPSASWMLTTFPDSDATKYNSDGLCGTDVHVDFSTTPLLHWFEIWQEVPAALTVPAPPTQDTTIDNQQLRSWEVTSEIGEPSDKGGIELEGRVETGVPAWRNESLAEWMQGQDDRRVTLRVWNTNDDGDELEEETVFKGMATLPESRDDGTRITADLITDVARLLDGTIDGRLIVPGDSWEVRSYVEYMLSSAGFVEAQYTGTLEDLYRGTDGSIPPPGPGVPWGPGRLPKGLTRPLWEPEAGRSWMLALQEVLAYAADADLWVEHSDSASHEALPRVHTGCRWCHQKRSPLSDGTDYYWDHLSGPGSVGCLAYDKARSGDATDGVDYHLHTRAEERHSSMEGEGTRQYILDTFPVRQSPLQDYYERIVVKGPRSRVKGAPDQIALAAELPQADRLNPEAAYRELEYQRSWIVDYDTAMRVIYQLFYRHTTLPRYIEVKVPLLPIAKKTHVFAIHGGERQDLNHTKWRIVKVRHQGSPLVKSSTTTLTGIYIGDLTP